MPGAERVEILAHLREQDRANAKGDAAGVAARMADDIATDGTPAPLEYRGALQPAIAGLGQRFQTWAGPATARLADPTVIVDGDHAAVFSRGLMHGSKKSYSPSDIRSRRTGVLRRIVGACRIVQEQSSNPAEADGSDRFASGRKP